MANSKTSAPKFLDLDAFDTGNVITVKLGGETHTLRKATVRDFIDNTKAVQALGVTEDLETQTQLTIDMLLKAFPTMKNEQLWELELEKLTAILDFAREHNGQKSVEDKIESESEAETEKN
jgi:hypothetical protein